MIFEGDATTANLVVGIDYETDKDICSWSFSIYLPEGITVAGEEEAGEFYPDEATLGTDTNARAIISNGIKMKYKSDGGLMVLGYSMSNAKMKSTHGGLCTILLKGSSSIVGSGFLKNTSCSYMEDGNAVSADQGLLADVEFAINGGEQGINDIKADAAAGKVYTIGGQQVVAPTKGLYIQNGKKVIVK